MRVEVKTLYRKKPDFQEIKNNFLDVVDSVLQARNVFGWNKEEVFRTRLEHLANAYAGLLSIASWLGFEEVEFEVIKKDSFEEQVIVFMQSISWLFDVSEKRLVEQTFGWFMGLLEWLDIHEKELEGYYKRNYLDDEAGC